MSVKQDVIKKLNILFPSYYLVETKKFKTFIRDLIEGTGVRVYTTATLTPAGWVNGVQTVTVNGVTASNYVTISAPTTRAQFDAYANSKISCTGQGTNTLTFTCESTTVIDIVLQIKIEE